MSSKSTYEYYKDDLGKVPVLRSMAETLLLDPRVRTVTAAEAYAMARTQWDTVETDLVMDPGTAKRLELPTDAKVLVNNHGKIVGRTAGARRFYNRLETPLKNKVAGDLRQAISDMQKRPLIKASAVVGLHQDLMIKATIIGAEDDANNIFNWLANFTPFEELADEYASSKELDILDIIVIGDNQWCNEDPYYENTGAPQLALVDEKANCIFNFGMRYFGERKKGTLTLAWTSGMKLGMAACHGGIKEFDLSGCADSKISALGKRSIAFFGLSGTGKSSHTNSADNGGTMPEGFKKVVLHDDAFQIDSEEKRCLVWEPSLFDKTDSRPVDDPDWNYMIAVLNHALIEVEGKLVPLGQDVRNANGRAILSRDLLGDHVNTCAFPQALAWLMKDTVLPPIIKMNNVPLALAMGTALMTKRNAAENVSPEELKKLVFVPFANPFRVYELYKDVEAFENVFNHGAAGYSFNSVGFWKSSDEDLVKIPLQTSLTIQTALVTDALEWEDWDMLPGAQIPTKASIDALIPGYYDMYNPANVENKEEYAETLKSRIEQRRDYINASDVAERPELLKTLIDSLNV